MVPNDRKLIVMAQPAAVINNQAVSSTPLDCIGFEYAEIIVYLGATDIAMTALKLQQSDALTGGGALSNPSDVTGTVFGTDVDDTGSIAPLPSAASDNKIFKFEVDLRGTKRFLNVACTIGNGAAGAYVTIVAELGRGTKTPLSAAEKGCANVMRP